MKKCLLILGLLAGAYITHIVWLEKAHNKILADKEYVIDSLEGETSTISIDIGCYEIILDKIRSVDSSLVDSVMRNVE